MTFKEILSQITIWQLLQPVLFLALVFYFRYCMLPKLGSDALKRNRKESLQPNSYNDLK
jgi:hypothetical protein